MFILKKFTCDKAFLYRLFAYLAGLLILALGITLNTKTGLGVSPIISVSYSISTINNWNFGNMTLVLYAIFVIVEMVLHTFVYLREKKENLKLRLLLDLLQFPLSLFFTRFLNLFSALIPDLGDAYGDQFAGSFVGRVCFLIVAIILTGIGAAMSLNMRLIPNPGDGIVQAISDTVHASVGLTKNCFDIFNISVTICVGLFSSGKLIGIGLGTVLAVIGVGRVIAVFNHFCFKPMNLLAGLETTAQETIPVDLEAAE